MTDFRNIMVPVDLQHAEHMEKALSAAAALSQQFGATVTLVGVTSPQPSAIAHNLEEFSQKLTKFAGEWSEKTGVTMQAETVDSPDPVRDLDDALAGAVKRLGADLVVMASHVPTFTDHLLASNAGALLSHTDASLFIVR